MNAVTALTSSNVWAVGDDGNFNASAYRWDGRRWMQAKTPSPGENAELDGMSALSSGDIWAVGYDYGVGNINYGTLAEHWNGLTWRVVHTPSPNIVDSRLMAVAAVGKDNVWAVGLRNVGQEDNGNYRTLVEHWTGSRWLVVPSPSPATVAGADLNGISAISKNDIWATGNFTFVNTKQNIVRFLPLLEHWNGKEWKIVASAATKSEDSTFTAIDATARGSAWLVGYQYRLDQNGHVADSVPLSERLVGSKWIIVPTGLSPKPISGLSGAQFCSAVTISSNSVWAAGQRPTSLTATQPLISRYRLCPSS